MTDSLQKKRQTMPLPQKTFYYEQYLHVTGWTARWTHQRQSLPHGPAVVDPSGTGPTAFPHNRKPYIRSWGPCKLYPAPYAVELRVDDETYAEPDISVIWDPGILDRRSWRRTIPLYTATKKMRPRPSLPSIDLSIPGSIVTCTSISLICWNKYRRLTPCWKSPHNPLKYRVPPFTLG